MKKRALFIVGALLLCATIVVGSTLAYLADTDEAINTFTFDKANTLIDIELKEPGWNEGTAGLNNKEPGKVTAEKFIPGSKIAKDPHVTLKKGVDTYVALIITADNTKDIKTVKEILDIAALNDYDKTNWEVKETNDAIYAYYRGGSNSGVLKVGTGTDTTEPLFKSISILNKYPAGHADAGKPIDQAAYGSFDLVVKAYGVQARNDEEATWNCKVAMQNAFPDAFANG